MCMYSLTFTITAKVVAGICSWHFHYKILRTYSITCHKHKLHKCMCQMYTQLYLHTYICILCSSVPKLLQAAQKFRIIECCMLWILKGFIHYMQCIFFCMQNGFCLNFLYIVHRYVCTYIYVQTFDHVHVPDYLPATFSAFVWVYPI